MANGFRFDISTIIEAIKEKMQDEYIMQHYNVMGDKDLKIILKGDIKMANYKRAYANSRASQMSNRSSRANSRAS